MGEPAEPPSLDKSGCHSGDKRLSVEGALASEKSKASWENMFIPGMHTEPVEV